MKLRTIFVSQLKIEHKLQEKGIIFLVFNRRARVGHYFRATYFARVRQIVATNDSWR